jgi:hypothetical protein
MQIVDSRDENLAIRNTCTLICSITLLLKLDAVLKSMKSQTPSSNLRVSGVGCQCRKTKRLKPEHQNLKPPFLVTRNT